MLKLLIRGRQVPPPGRGIHSFPSLPVPLHPVVRLAWSPSPSQTWSPPSVRLPPYCSLSPHFSCSPLPVPCLICRTEAGLCTVPALRLSLAPFFFFGGPGVFRNWFYGVFEFLSRFTFSPGWGVTFPPLRELLGPYRTDHLPDFCVPFFSLSCRHFPVLRCTPPLPAARPRLE